MLAMGRYHALIAVFIIALQLCAAFHKQSLDGTWIVGSNKHAPFQGEVPGGIYSDLMRKKLIPNIFLEYGDIKSRWVGETRWTYKRTFDASADILKYNHAVLVLEGVDTFATIQLNGKLIGSTDNMFVRYELPIDGLLQATNNELIVTFDSPTKKAKELYEKQAKNYVVPPKCVPDDYHGECHVNHIRKMQASFSWDWGPAFPSVGLWKSAYINAYNQTYIKDVLVDILFDGDYFKFVVRTYMATNNAKTLNGVLRFEVDNKHNEVDTINFQIQDIVSNDNEFVVANNFSLHGSKFDLWWPNGYGRQPLYQLKVTMLFNDGEFSIKTLRVAMREVELVQSPVGSGLSFYFLVNQIPIFAKGSNMVPSHILPENSNNVNLVKQMMQGAKDVHMNMIRVWGGGLYEADVLYDLADEMGIMIWQDFMFACSMYPVNSEFLSTVEEEIEHQIRRLQYHPSIVLWAGNNENEAALTGNWYGTSSNRTTYDADYRQLYGKTIRDIVLRIDPYRKYLSSSPTNGVKSEEAGFISPNPGDSKYGDVHFYNYIFDSWDINVYPTPRFSSEYGYQALPSYNSMLSIVQNSSSLLVGSDFMNHIQHHPMGNTEMNHLIGMRLQLPDKTDMEKYTKSFFFYSQILQAMAVKIETEHYRQWQNYLNSAGNGNTMGALYWQLNCPWLAPTWSGVESTGKWKMLQYYAKDFFAPVIVTSHLYPNHTVDLYIVSDRLSPYFNATLKVTIFNWNSLTAISEKVRQVDIKMGSTRLTKINLKFFLRKDAACGDNNANCVVRLTLTHGKNDVLIAPENFIYPVPHKNAAIPFANVQIVQVNGISSRKFLITVVTDLPAAFVWLESSMAGIFSENGFNMFQQKKWIMFNSAESTNPTELLESLHVTHLRDNYYFS